MSGWLIGVVGIIYLGVAIDQFIKGNTGMGIVWFGYALANAGFVFVVE
jgi:hypothetical protein